MEYQKVGATSWTQASEGGTPVTVGTYVVRYKASDIEDNKCFASASTSQIEIGCDYVALDDNTAVTIKKGEDAIGDTAPVVDDVLTVSCGASDLIYEWFVGEESKGVAAASNTSYTVLAEDAGKAIMVKAYQIKQENGQDYAENGRPMKSATTPAVVKKTAAELTADEAKTNSVINYIAETVTPLDGYQVSSSNTEYQAVDSITDILDEQETPTIYVRRAETDDTAAGEWVAVTLSTRPAAPNNLGSTDAATGSSADGTITGVDDTMEYSADGTSWTVVEFIPIKGLNPGTYSVRVKATDHAPHGIAATVTVGCKEIILAENQKPTPKTGLTFTGAEQVLLNKPAEALPSGAVEIRYALGKDATTEPTSDWEISIPAKINAETYYVWYKAIGDGNHNDTNPACLTVSISKAAVTVKAMDQRIYVGGTVPVLTAPVLDTHYTIAGLMGKDTLTTAPTLAYQKNGVAATPDNTVAGTYDIVPSGASTGDNYTISYESGTLTIGDKAQQTITAEDVTATFGDADKSIIAKETLI